MSPRNRARMAGGLYVLEGITSVFGQLWVPGRLVVSGDAAATAANILGSETLFRMGIASGLLGVALHAALTVVFYDLFRPVARSVARLFAFLTLIAIALQAVSVLLQLPALIALGDGSVSSALGSGGSNVLALLFLRTSGQAFNVYLVFFGFRCAAMSYLIYKSGFLPRLIGVLMAFTALGYLTLLWPPLAESLHPLNLAVVAPGELSLVAWLLVAGVDSERWRRRAAAAAAESGSAG